MIYVNSILVNFTKNKKQKTNPTQTIQKERKNQQPKPLPSFKAPNMTKSKKNKTTTKSNLTKNKQKQPSTGILKFPFVKFASYVS